VKETMLDNSTIEKVYPPELFALSVGRNQSLTSACSSLNEFSAIIESHEGQSVALVQLEDGAPTPWPGDISVQDANRWERAIRRLEHSAAIVITTASGRCGGTALDFLLVSDYRIAGPDFNLELPINSGQFWPGMAIHRLVQQVGLARARQIVLWGQSMDVHLCLSTGLIDEVSEDFASATARLTSLVTGRKGSELAIRRRLLLEATSAPYEEALGPHLAACDRELRRLRRGSQI